MASKSQRQKRFLFVDDDADFLEAIQHVFSGMADGDWQILTAANHGQALALLQQQRVDVIVLDLDMPVMDGLQFLRLLSRTHPGHPVVMLSGHATQEQRQSCLDNGAALFLEKAIVPDGFAAIFAALDALAGATTQDGFRGLMRRVGLQDVIQMECLGRKSSVLQVLTGSTRGHVFISDGAIVHAESGGLVGEAALYKLLGLQGGEFSLSPFAEPPQRTISGQYEFLLMEAARLRDEASPSLETEAADAGREVSAEDSVPQNTAPSPVLPSLPVDRLSDLSDHTLATRQRVRIEEVLLCSGAGEVLYEWQCRALDSRTRLLDLVDRQAGQLNHLLPLGRFERLEILTPLDRIVCHVQPHMRLFMRRPLQPPNPP